MIGRMVKCPECGQVHNEDKSNYYSIVPYASSSPMTPSQINQDEELIDIKSVVDSLATHFREDIDYLLSLGIKLDKGASVAKTGGLALAGYEGFTGDWLSALVIGGISLLVGGLTDSYKKIKVQEIQKKWFDILSGLNEEEMMYLMENFQRKYPVLAVNMQRLLGA